jgi:hypothetical protein
LLSLHIILLIKKNTERKLMAVVHVILLAKALTRLRVLLFVLPLFVGVVIFGVEYMNMMYDPQHYHPILLIIGGSIVDAALVLQMAYIYRRRLVFILPLLVGMSVSLGLCVAYSKCPEKMVYAVHTYTCYVCGKIIEGDGDCETAYYSSTGHGIPYAALPNDARKIAVHKYCTPPQRIKASETEPLYNAREASYRWERGGLAGLLGSGAFLFSLATIVYYLFLLRRAYTHFAEYFADCPPSYFEGTLTKS